MTKVGDVLGCLERLAPTELKMDFDNVGLLAGDSRSEVKKITVALDITDAVIEEALKSGAQLIVSHHPIFFDGLKSVTDGSAAGRKLLRLISGGVSAICMHTNLDAAPSGVNDCLASAIGARVTGILNTDDGISRVCELPKPENMSAFLPFVKKALGANGLRYVDSGRPVKKLGICGGAGGADIELAALSGCDTFLTADVKHHQFIAAGELGVNLIDAGHFCTENVVVRPLAEKLRAEFPDTEVLISAVCVQPESFLM